MCIHVCYFSLERPNTLHKADFQVLQGATINSANKIKNIRFRKKNVLVLVMSTQARARGRRKEKGERRVGGRGRGRG